MPNIFISYRREDSFIESHNLYKSLVNNFGENSVYIDDEKTPVGEYFIPYLHKKLDWADVILIVIGEKWKGRKEQFGYKINSSRDYVRQEVEYAVQMSLINSKHIVPITIFPTTLNNTNLTYEFEFLRSFNGIELNPNNTFESINFLTQKLNELPSKNNQNIKELITIDQGINLFQRINLYGGKRNGHGKFPDDCEVFLFKIKEGIQWELFSKKDPFRNINSYHPNINTSMDTIQETMGAIVEWFGVIPKFYIEESYINKKTNLLYHLFPFFVKKRFKWRKIVHDFKFSCLHDLILEFNKDLNYRIANEQIPIIDLSPPKEGENIGFYYNKTGYFKDHSNGIFGKYICSLTLEIGSQLREGGRIVRLPNISQTRLQYIDYYKKPYFLKPIKFCGHIGLDQNGYHIVFN
ncbi:toll/interleukin-1 receptor domain-containing protein [Tenacibaculum agarivorans]|uniref:toll/interleukin-1 receptor domain-containing protein n=1 Tax=Tenacibaculum agarivorans TaxID=1908389 RepID=UPI00094BAA0E|nr:toll/interleukin-1 receptor domain-containing protein [Tenacibaculum agarivorans]